MATSVQGTTVVFDGNGGNLMTADGGQYLTVAPGSSLTVQQAQAYVNDAISQGVPAAWIADFISRNPEDYPRIVNGYFSDAGVVRPDQNTGTVTPPASIPPTPTTGQAIPGVTAPASTTNDASHDTLPASTTTTTVDLNPPYNAGPVPTATGASLPPDVQTFVAALQAAGITGQVTVPASVSGGQPIVVSVPASGPVTAAAAPSASAVGAAGGVPSWVWVAAAFLVAMELFRRG